MKVSLIVAMASAASLAGAPGQARLALPAGFPPLLLKGWAAAESSAPRAGCDGYLFPVSPQQEIELQKPTRELEVRLFSLGNTALLLSVDGQQHCLSNEATASWHGTGRSLQLFVGARIRGLRHRYAVALLRSSDRSVMEELSEQAEEEIDPDERANTEGDSHWLDLSRGPLPRTITVSGRASRAAPLSVPSCRGNFELGPRHWLQLPQSAEPIPLTLETKEGALLVRTPSGQVLCQPAGNPILLSGGGMYQLFVGRPEAKALTYRIRIGRRQRTPPPPPVVWGNSILAFGTSLGPARFLPVEGRLMTTPQRTAGLNAVVRVRSGERMVCTGTLVEWQGSAALLTAAHCLHRLDAQGRFLGLDPAIAADGLPPLQLESARIPAAFSDCAAEGLPYGECVDRGASDVAIVPLREPTELVPWRLCVNPPGNLELSLFGYGLDHGKLPRELMRGDFRVVDAPERGLWKAFGRDGQQSVGPGDSGGPVVALEDDQSLGEAVPQVCFVVAGVETRPAAGGPPGAFLQPVWLPELGLGR